MIVKSLVSWMAGLGRDANTTVLASMSSLVLGPHLMDYWKEAGHLVEGLQQDGFPWHLLSYLLLTVAIIYVYRLAFSPLDRVRDITEVGWGYLGGDGNTPLAERIREVQRLRKTGNLPPVYPNGWFAVVESRQVAVAQVVPVQVFGETLAVFRGEDGEAHVTDAYCPHIGANLAVGGVVKGDCLECPFHGWLFRGSDGACVHIPYSSKVPKTAKVKRWESREVNGFIFVWHDAEDRPPMWEVPEVVEVTDGTWSYRGRTVHQVLAHIQEIPENGADLAHLGHLHVPSIFKGSDLRDIFAHNQVLDLAKHSWHGEWQVRSAPDSHTADLTVTHAFTVFGGKFKLFTMTVRAEQVGPGLVHLHFNTALGSGVLVQTVTPLEPLRQKVVHHFYSSRSFIAPYAKFVLFSEARHFERDVMVWNNKQFMSQPLLVSEDRLILRFRRWYNQFYSDNSPKFTFRKDNYEW
ncbi:cholesterol 7-desaturase nvd [Panulirus ornatus]|uniref:cholesterol 7-desaturase nvd n=1 Tax=Panulirus ornatus TaxID=150431 RepID=UPI003A879815